MGPVSSEDLNVPFYRKWIKEKLKETKSYSELLMVSSK